MGMILTINNNVEEKFLRPTISFSDYGELKNFVIMNCYKNGPFCIDLN